MSQWSSASRSILSLVLDYPASSADKMAHALKASRNLGAWDVQNEALAATTWQSTPEDALRYLEGKVAIPWRQYEGLQDGMLRSQAFWMAGVEQVSVLEDVLGGLRRALRTGQTFDEFAREWAPKLLKEGINEGRLQTVYRTNLATAYMGGRMAALKENPLITDVTYVTMQDEKVRHDHALLNGVTRPKDDPWWQTHTPPLGYNCRCVIRGAEKGRAVTSPDDPRMGAKADPGFEAGSGNILSTYLNDQATKFPEVRTVSPEGEWDWLLTAKTNIGGRVVGESEPRAGYVDSPSGRTVAVTDAVFKAVDPGAAPYVRSALQAPAEVWAVPSETAEGDFVLRLTYLARTPSGVLVLQSIMGNIAATEELKPMFVDDPQWNRIGIRID